jgi:hypothetical protein
MSDDEHPAIENKRTPTDKRRFDDNTGDLQAFSGETGAA